MSEKSLAVKYRPTTFSDVVEQDSVKAILLHQLKTGTVKHAYLFCGGAGTGKTTCARIFASDINKGEGTPIEMDAASHNGVDDVRDIIKQAQTKSIDSEYKVFVIDECHSLSNTAWQAMLKLIEEPPEKSIFIFCTTDPQKIPNTILSRVQRFDFKRISQKSIVDRLQYILTEENEEDDGERAIGEGALEYISKVADGGMRDAITLLDKCLSYSEELTVENVIKVLGVSTYDFLVSVFNNLYICNAEATIRLVEEIYEQGKDLKLFIKDLLNFTIDVVKYMQTNSLDFVKFPKSCAEQLEGIDNIDMVCEMLDMLVKLNADIKWVNNPKYDIEARFLLFELEDEE